jgi:hypothetical protein
MLTNQAIFVHSHGKGTNNFEEKFMVDTSRGLSGIVVGQARIVGFAPSNGWANSV